MVPTLSLGPLSLPVPAILLIFGFWLGSVLAEKEAARLNIKVDSLANLLLLSLLIGLLGARISYAATFPGAFQGNLLSLVSLNPNLLDPQAGLLLALFSSWVIGQRSSLPLWRTLDALIPFFGSMLFFFHLSKFAAGTGYGLATDLPWAIQLWGATRHPVQLYLSLGILTSTAAFMLLPSFQKRLPGARFLHFLSLISIWEVFASGFKQSGSLIGPGVRLAQLGFFILAAAGLIAYHSLWRRYRKEETFEA